MIWPERRHVGIRPERVGLPRPTGWGTVALVYGCLLVALVAAVVWGTRL